MADAAQESVVDDAAQRVGQISVQEVHQEAPGLPPALLNKIDETGLTAALKMYVKPITDVLPLNIDYAPYQSERLRVPMANRPYAYTPAMWMEPLRPFQMQLPVAAGPNNVPPARNRLITNNDFAHFAVEVSAVRRAEQNIPGLSSLGATLKTFLSTDFTASQMSAPRSLQQTRELRDIQATANIVSQLPNAATCYYDEAPLLRCLLLSNTIIGVGYVMHQSSIVQQTMMNMQPVGQPVTAWAALPADGVVGVRSKFFFLKKG